MDSFMAGIEHPAPSISDAKSARIFTLTSPDILIAWCLILQNKPFNLAITYN